MSGAAHRVREIRCLLRMAAGCFAVHALSYLLMPLALRLSENGGSKTPTVLVSCTFWIPLLGGYALIFLANAKRKTLVRNRLYGGAPVRCRMGMFTFFSNTPAMIVDAALLAGAAALVILCCGGVTSHYVTYVFLTIVSFSLNMHGLFNGRIYRSTKYRYKRRDENHEQCKNEHPA